LKLWKSRTPRNKAAPNDLVARLNRDIPRVRNPGDPPDKDPGSFSRFFCDLCNMPHGFSELRQCVVCGRWACPTCWTEEYYLCNSCNGMLRLHTIRDRHKP